MNFVESAKLAEAIKRDLTCLAIDRQIEAVAPEDAARVANLLIIRYLSDVIGAIELAEQFAACVGVAFDAPQPAEPAKRRRQQRRTPRPRARVA